MIQRKIMGHLAELHCKYSGALIDIILVVQGNLQISGESSILLCDVIYNLWVTMKKKSVMIVVVQRNIK